jgi:hypothetical protein
MSADVFWYVMETFPAVARATLRRLTTMVRHLCERVF